MDAQIILCIITLASVPGAATLMLIWGMLQKPNLDAEGNEILGRGPRCDVCGEYLSTHDMYQCESYC